MRGGGVGWGGGRRGEIGGGGEEGRGEMRGGGGGRWGAEKIRIFVRGFGLGCLRKG